LLLAGAFLCAGKNSKGSKHHHEVLDSTEVGEGKEVLINLKNVLADNIMADGADHSAIQKSDQVHMAAHANPQSHHALIKCDFEVIEGCLLDAGKYEAFLDAIVEACFKEKLNDNIIKLKSIVEEELQCSQLFNQFKVVARPGLAVNKRRKDIDNLTRKVYNLLQKASKR
jgi:hypothetical protein